MPMRDAALRAALTLAAVVAAFLTAASLCRWLGASVQPAIVAAFMTISLAGRPRLGHGAHPVTRTLALAAIAPLAAGVGWLLHAVPAAGAAVFVALMSASVWLRNFPGPAARIGSMTALPLIAILVIPPPATTARGGPAIDLALAVCAGAIALACAGAAARVAVRAGIVLATVPAAPVPRADPARTGGGPSVPTRMAIQMAVALAAAFVAGFALFAHHWGWTVLTAFIVCSGTRGRGDAAYKGVLRLCGAALGTVLAAALSFGWPAASGGLSEALAIFGALYVGLLLRDVNYAYWACCMTLVLALLARSSGALGIGLLEVRMLAILTGAVCAVAATWFVFPIRTRAVIRRRLAAALVAFDDIIAHAGPATRAEKLRAFEDRLAELESVAVPVEWYRRLLPRACGPDHPAAWIERVRGLRDHAAAAAAGQGVAQPADVRRAIGRSRRAIADHGNGGADSSRLTVRAALDGIHAALTPREAAT